MSREEDILNNAADDEDLEDLADLNDAVEVTDQGLKLNIELGDVVKPEPVEITAEDLA